MEKGRNNQQRANYHNDNKSFIYYTPEIKIQAQETLKNLNKLLEHMSTSKFT